MMAAPDAPRQNRDRMLRLFKRTETLFATRFPETRHAAPKLYSTPLAGPEAAATRAIFGVEVVAGVEVGGMIVETEGEIVILISEIEETLPIGMNAVESASVPTGATAIGIALEGVGRPLVRARHLEGIFETRETRAMALLV